MTDDPSGEFLLGAVTLAVDMVTAEVTDAFDARGIDAVLLKGPSLTRALYGDGASRPYMDTDLLVAPDRFSAAQQLLCELGFTRALEHVDHRGVESETQHLWVRAGDQVDLHCTLDAARAAPETVWQTLAALTETQRVGGRKVRVLRRPALAMHVALHAAHHGPRALKTTMDLERALEQFSLDEWRTAAALAERLQATDVFAEGLRLQPRGRELVATLGLERVRSVDAALEVTTTPLARGFQELARTSDAAAKARLVLRELAPSPSFLRWWTPLARRGRAGLAAAYVWRLFWLVANAPRGLLAWRRARSPKR